MATGKVAVTEGAGVNLATHTLTEDAVTKHVSRVNLNDSAGADIFGSKTDDKSTATDTTSASLISLVKQLSASLQVLASAILAEDTASASTDKGIQLLAKRAASPANTSSADGDYEPVQVNGGLLWTDTQAHGDVAHDGADSGKPVKVGARARSSEITAVSSDDRSDLITDLVGKLIVLPYANPENFVSGAITTAMTGTTTTSLIAAPAAGLRNYITQITVSNAHATVGTDVVIQDGSGGTTLYTIPAAAVYGGAVITFPTPLRQPTTATAIFCANVTTGASTKVSASGYKGA